MKNNFMFFLAIFLLSVGISKADVFEEMFEELTKGAKSSKQDSMGVHRGPAVGGSCDSNNCLGGLSDGRSKDEIMQVVNENMPSLKKIYNQYLKQKPGFSGKITIKFTVAANGEIIKINIISSTTGYAKFDKAIKDKVATWKWKAIKSGNTTPTIPFNFTEEDESWDI